jgi:ABC-type dipeptide/oligopeptide/nickel transport system permease subunit
MWRCLLGGLISLGIGLAAAGISVLIGTAWGAIAGWYGGRIDNLMMRMVDILYGLPYILLIILLKIAFGPKLINLLNAVFGPGQELWANIIILFLAIGGVSWLTMARVIRGQVLSLKAQPFIEAARTLGVPAHRIIGRHLLPNLIGPIMVYATLTVPQAILQESFLSFLGIGIKDPVPTWGALAAEGVQAVNTVASFWWMLVFPCGLLGVTLLALNFIGDGLRDALDPKTIKS